MPTPRSTLKVYFERGKRPTQEQFAEFIDSTFNQKDDAIFQATGQPLSIRSVGDEEGALDLYGVENDRKQLAWQLKLKPGGKLGLSIHDATESRLFIARGTGNIGIATTEPKTKLHIAAGSDARPSEANSGYLIIGDAAGKHLALDSSSIVAKDTATTSGTLKLQYDGGETVLGGKVTVRESGNLFFGYKTRQMINLWGDEYGIGLQASTQYFRTGNSFAWYRGGTHHDSALQAGKDGQLQMVINAHGHVGIGTVAPEAKLDVEGHTRLGKGIAESWFPHGNGWAYISGKGIIFLDDVAGQSVERMRIDDHGNVGIGTQSPGEKLHVHGNVHVQDNVNFTMRTRQMINLWGTHYGIGIQSHTQYFRTHKYFAWYKGGTHDDATFNPGSDGALQMVIKDGNVGIATSAPLAKLHIEDGSDASPSEHGYLMLGPVDGHNLVLDDNEIMARNNGTPSPLLLNADGGGVSVGGGTALKKVIAGRVDGGGGVHSGDGFTSQKTAKGTYEVTFDNAFASEPVVVATSSDFDDDKTISVGVTTAKLTIHIHDQDGAREDGQFSFIAVEV